MKILSSKVMNIAKWIWLASVILFILLFFYNKYNSFIVALMLIRPEFLFLCFVLLIIGKIFLTVNMQLSLRITGVDIPFIKSFHIYNLTQLSKYIPGGIWFFVGRFGVYHNEGIKFDNTKNGLIIEIGALTLSSLVIGILLIGLTNNELVDMLLTQANLDLKSTDILFLLIVPLIAIIPGVFWFKLSGLKVSFPMILKQGAVQMAIWFVLGASFASIAIVFIEKNVFLYLIGLYSTAYIVGFLFPFAPGGIGIREGIIVIGLSSWLSIDQAIAISVLHRVLYLIVEVILVLQHELIKFVYVQKNGEVQ